jgi:hypothetical protein
VAGLATTFGTRRRSGKDAVFAARSELARALLRALGEIVSLPADELDEDSGPDRKDDVEAAALLRPAHDANAT